MPYAGLYYDGNSGVWYSFDDQTQQYIRCTDQNDNKASGKESEPSKATDGSNNRRVVISAPAATITSVEKPPSLPDAVQAAASAAIAAEKKGKERSKETKFALKNSIVPTKKKINNVTMWKQWSHENHQPASADDRLSVGQSTKNKVRSDLTVTKENLSVTSGFATVSPVSQAVGSESQVKPKPVSNSSGGTLMGVIRNSGRGFHSGSSGVSSTPMTSAPLSSSTASELPTAATPFRTDASALGSYVPPLAAGSGKRRFSEMPLASIQKEQPQAPYRDRAAERRSLYGSSSSIGDDLLDLGFGDSSKHA